MLHVCRQTCSDANLTYQIVVDGIHHLPQNKQGLVNGTTLLQSATVSTHYSTPTLSLQQCLFYAPVCLSQLSAPLLVSIVQPVSVCNTLCALQLCLDKALEPRG